MRISVAIPNYKNSDTLINLIDELVKEPFDRIFVLDDCSPNISILKDSLSKYNKVKVIPSKTRLLPTKNRNRILGLKIGTVVLFLDSDLKTISKDIFQELSSAFQDENLAILGGQILEKGRQMSFGYGTGLFWPIDRSWLFTWIHPISKLVFRFLHQKSPDHPVDASWVAEGVMAVRFSAFEELNGFDPNYELFHEGPDLCHRAIKKGFRVIYDPNIKFEHLHIEHIEKKNNINRSSAYWFYKNCGWPKWLANFLFRYKGRDISEVS